MFLFSPNRNNSYTLGRFLQLVTLFLKVTNIIVKQKHDKLEDLLVNESFLNYYFQKNDADTWEWEEFQEDFPNSKILLRVC